MANTFRLFAVLLLSAGPFCTNARAQTAPPPPPQQSIKPDDWAGTSVDVARIKKLLNAPPDRLTVPKVVLDNRLPTPTYYVDVFGYKPPHLPTLAEQFDEMFPRSQVPAPLAEFGRDMQLLHPLNAIQAARGAWYRHKVARTKREVEEELRALEALQAAKPADTKTPKKEK